MSNGDLFYVCGVALAVSAVLVSFAGLRIKRFPGKAAPIVALGFIALIGSAASFAVLHAQDEEEAKAAEFSEANEGNHQRGGLASRRRSPGKQRRRRSPKPAPRARAAPCSSPPPRRTSPSTRRA